MTGDLWQIDGTTGVVLAQTVLPGRAQVRNADPAVWFSPDGARLAIGTANTNQLVVFDTGTAKEVWAVKFENETAGGVRFAPDGKTVAVATSGGKVRLFDAVGKSAGVLPTGIRGMTNVALSPDGAAVVVATGDGVVAWDRGTNKELWKRQTRAEYSLTFSPKRRRKK